MRRQYTRSVALLVAFAGTLGLLTAVNSASAQTLGKPPQPSPNRWGETTLFAFNGADGEFATGSVILDSSGTLFGTTGGGGELDHGVAFSLTRTRAGWTETVLHSFTGYDGDNPVGALLPGPHGSFFGAASSGGSLCGGSICLGGTVFELSPPASGSGAWTITVLHNFSPTDPAGAAPAGSLIADSHGDLFGSAQLGGQFGDGLIFELMPPPAGTQKWTAKVLHTFRPAGDDGLIPTRGLIAGSDGTLYGTTEDGGSGAACISGCGTVFALTPPQHNHGDWTERILYSFTDANGDGSLPEAGLVAGTDGSLYGTTTYGGTSNGGTAFRLSPSSRTGSWTETVLHEFSKTNGDGYYPVDALITGPRGALFGTTSFGGSLPPKNGGGIVFRLNPPDAGSGAWGETILHHFNRRISADSWASVFQGPNDVLYGSTVVGGNPVCAQGCGTIFALFPPV